MHRKGNQKRLLRLKNGWKPYKLLWQKLKKKQLMLARVRLKLLTERMSQNNVNKKH